MTEYKVSIKEVFLIINEVLNDHRQNLEELQDHAGNCVSKEEKRRLYMAEYYVSEVLKGQDNDR